MFSIRAKEESCMKGIAESFSEMQPRMWGAVSTSEKAALFQRSEKYCVRSLC